MNEKSKKFALIGDMAGLLGFVAGCSGIACGILERYQALPSSCWGAER